MYSLRNNAPWKDKWKRFSDYPQTLRPSSVQTGIETTSRHLPGISKNMSITSLPMHSMRWNFSRTSQRHLGYVWLTMRHSTSVLLPRSLSCMLLAISDSVLLTPQDSVHLDWMSSTITISLWIVGNHRLSLAIRTSHQRKVIISPWMPNTVPSSLPWA